MVLDITKLKQPDKPSVTPESLTEQDVQFLAKLKAQGMNKDTALEVLASVKSKAAAMETPAFLKRAGAAVAEAAPSDAGFRGELLSETADISVPEAEPKKSLSLKLAEALPGESGIEKAAAEGSQAPTLSALTTQNPLVQMGVGAAKGAVEVATGIGGKIEEFLGLEPVGDKIKDPKVKAEYDKLSQEFASTIEREGFSQKAGKTLFDLGITIGAGGLGGKLLGSVASQAGATGKALTAAQIAGESVGSTLGFEAATEQELPTPTEFGLDLVASFAIPTILRKSYQKLKPKEVDEIIDAAFTKAVRPSVKGKKSIASLGANQENARTAVKTVVALKDALELTGDTGKKVIGQLPENLYQFGEAVDQAQDLIFRQYDNLAIDAGQQGVKVNFQDVLGDKLDEVIESKALQATDPATIKYAQTLKERYAALGEFGVEDTQEVIKGLNAKLKNFYGKASGDTYSELYVDSLVANNLRKQLDELIQGATGGAYQELKNAYGALKAIQDDLMNRIIVDARKNGVSLPQFADVFSVGDIVAGLGTLNPAQIAKGGIQIALRNLFTKFNDPNEIIRKMFEQLDEVAQKVD